MRLHELLKKYDPQGVGVPDIWALRLIKVCSMFHAFALPPVL